MFRQTQCVVLGLMTAFALSSARAGDLNLRSSFGRLALQEASWTSDLHFCNAKAAEQAQPGPAPAQVAPSGACCEPACGCAGNGCGDCGGCNGCGCEDPCCLNGQSRWTVWAWGGGTYYSTSFESLFGFAEGVTLGYRLTEATGLLGQIGFNHTGRSTQILGTVGAQKFGNPYGGSMWERTSVWVLWDQFTDTRFANLYVHQLRLNVGFVPAERREIGMSFSIPTSGGGVGGALIPLGGPGLLSSGTEFIGPYLSTEVGDGGQLTTMVGYMGGAGNTGGAAFGVGYEQPMNDNLNFITDAKYGTSGLWALSAGVSLGLGRQDTKRY